MRKQINLKSTEPTTKQDESQPPFSRLQLIFPLGQAPWGRRQLGAQLVNCYGQELQRACNLWTMSS